MALSFRVCGHRSNLLVGGLCSPKPLIGIGVRMVGSEQDCNGLRTKQRKRSKRGARSDHSTELQVTNSCPQLSQDKNDGHDVRSHTPLVSCCLVLPRCYPSSLRSRHGWLLCCCLLRNSLFRGLLLHGRRRQSYGG